MQFKPELAEKILRGEKTQTRRPVHEGDVFWPWAHINVKTSAGDFPARVRSATGAMRYKVGATYAVQPGRGKPAVARIRITDIRREDVRNISEEDAIAEGFASVFAPMAAFLEVWTGFYDHEAYRHLFEWDYLKSRPAALYDAWALTFEVVK